MVVVVFRKAETDTKIEWDDSVLIGEARRNIIDVHVDVHGRGDSDARLLCCTLLHHDHTTAAAALLIIHWWHTNVIDQVVSAHDTVRLGALTNTRGLDRINHSTWPPLLPSAKCSLVWP